MSKAVVLKLKKLSLTFTVGLYRDRWTLARITITTSPLLSGTYVGLRMGLFTWTAHFFVTWRPLPPIHPYAVADNEEFPLL